MAAATSSCVTIDFIFFAQPLTREFDGWNQGPVHRKVFQSVAFLDLVKNNEEKHDGYKSCAFDNLDAGNPESPR